MLAYLDHAAGGSPDPSVADAMLPWLTGRFGNPSGAHQVSRSARIAVEDARDVLAAFLGVEPGGVIFTSGGTEADNLAVLGVAAANPGAVVISAVEHPAVTEAALASGRELRIAPVGKDGIVDLEGLRQVVDAGVSLVSVQLANHETGVIQPLDEIARRVKKWAPRAVIHTDAVQGAQWMDLADATAAVDLVSISGHKFGAPQGVGALGIRGRPHLKPILYGGGQEREMRSGTHNVPGIVGLAAAVLAGRGRREHLCSHVGSLRDELSRAIRAEVDDCRETAALAPRLPGHLHLRFPGVESESLLVLLDEQGVCASAGAACASGALNPSPVLLAMGLDKSDALSALRLTLGPSTTPEEIEHAATVVPGVVARLRAS